MQPSVIGLHLGHTQSQLPNTVMVPVYQTRTRHIKYAQNSMSESKTTCTCKTQRTIEFWAHSNFTSRNKGLSLHNPKQCNIGKTMQLMHGMMNQPNSITAIMVFTFQRHMATELQIRQNFPAHHRKPAIKPGENDWQHKS